MGNPVFLYDGVCGLCNRSVQFILRHDTRTVFRFAPLQSEFARRILARHGANPADLDTVYVVPASNDVLLARSDAALHVLAELGGIWRAASRVLRLVPRRVRDWGYRVIARNRYRIFGRHDTCPAPDPAVRERFLDR